MNIKTVGLIVGGVVLTLISFPCVATGVFDLLTGTDNPDGAFIITVFFAPVLLVGVGLLVIGAKSSVDSSSNSEEDGPDIERVVLQTAAGSNGHLTVGNLAMQTNLSVDQANQILETLESKGVARSTVGEQGNIEYVFPGLGGGDGPDALEAEIERAVAELPEEV